MSKTTLIYCIIILCLCVGIGFEEFRIYGLKSDIAKHKNTISLLNDNAAALELEKSLQARQLETLRELVDANRVQFEEFKKAEAERTEVIEKLETVVIEKGSEDKIGVVTTESSDSVKELFNKKIKKFNEDR